MINKKYIITQSETVELNLLDSGLWVDSSGTVYSDRDSASVDFMDRCGVGCASFPIDSPLNDACKAHDYVYISKAYQTFHTRKEADEMLYKHFKLIHQPVLAVILYRLARWFGGKYWENPKTNN